MTAKPKGDKGPPATNQKAAAKPKANAKPKATPKPKPPAKPKADAPLIFPKMIAIMRAVGSIAKDRENPQQKYSFRGVDDVYNELHDILAKEGVITIPDVLEERAEDRESSSGKKAIYRILKIRYRFCAEDGSYVESNIIGEGMDWGDKAANKAMSVAHKYVLLQTFCIPTSDPKDPEADKDIPVGTKGKTYGGKKEKTSGGKKETPPENENGKSYPVVRFPVSGEEKLLNRFQILDRFKDAKTHLGVEEYYRVLNSYGFEKSDKIALEDMREVYESMIAVYQERISKTKTEKPKEKK